MSISVWGYFLWWALPSRWRSFITYPATLQHLLLTATIFNMELIMALFNATLTAIINSIIIWGMIKLVIVQAQAVWRRFRFRPTPVLAGDVSSSYTLS
jgi:hypothetical protein